MYYFNQFIIKNSAIDTCSWIIFDKKFICECEFFQIFDDGSDPDSLFDRLKEEETISPEKKTPKVNKPRKVSKNNGLSVEKNKKKKLFDNEVKLCMYILYKLFH